MKRYLVVLNYYKYGYERDEDYRQYESDSIEDCQKAVRKYITDNEVASSEWYGGNLYDLEARKQIGMIAYNGRHIPNMANV